MLEKIQTISWIFLIIGCFIMFVAYPYPDFSKQAFTIFVATLVFYIAAMLWGIFPLKKEK